MDFKPIFDKAKEFVEFYISVMEELLGEKLERHKFDLFDIRDTYYTRNHLVYSPPGQLFTPIRTLYTPYRGKLNLLDKKQLNARLIEKFSLVDIRPDINVSGGEILYPLLYCVPLDPKQPGLELPPPLFGYTSMLTAYEPRMKAVFRRYDTALFNRYVWIRSGFEFGQFHGEQMHRMRDEFNKWQEEVSKIDDDVPFGKGTIELLRRKFLGE